MVENVDVAAGVLHVRYQLKKVNNKLVYRRPPERNPGMCRCPDTFPSRSANLVAVSNWLGCADTSITLKI
ncbi:hypothetical protein ACFW9L_22645 [Streptomyces sp. NPDC059517]|uniref:hypothetical protein n=1 Tax=Streptomyces sp. NPDC059517 TaxID=3346855 RepID=UPI003683C0F6